MKQWFLMLAQALWKFVQIIIDDVFNNERHLAALSFLTFVALDEDGKPTDVPGVYPETDVENGSTKVLHNA